MKAVLLTAAVGSGTLLLLPLTLSNRLCEDFNLVTSNEESYSLNPTQENLREASPMSAPSTHLSFMDDIYLANADTCTLNLISIPLPEDLRREEQDDKDETVETVCKTDSVCGRVQGVGYRGRSKQIVYEIVQRVG